MREQSYVNEMLERESKRLSDEDISTCLFGGFGVSSIGLAILYVGTLSIVFSLVLSGILVVSFGLMFGYLQKGLPAAWQGMAYSSIGGVLGSLVSLMIYLIITIS